MGARTLSAEGRRGEVRFADAEHFKRWCDNDPIRFEHPLLHVNLKRDADELWRSSDASEP